MMNADERKNATDGYTMKAIVDGDYTRYQILRPDGTEAHSTWEGTTAAQINKTLNTELAPIEDLLAVKNAEIARLQAWKSGTLTDFEQIQRKIKAILNETDDPIITALAKGIFLLTRNGEADKQAPAAPQEEEYFKSEEYYQDLTDTFMGYDGTNNPVSKAAPQEAVTLTRDDFQVVDCPKCEGQCRHVSIDEVGDEVFVVCRFCNYVGEIYYRHGKAYRDANGEYQQIPDEELGLS